MKLSDKVGDLIDRHILGGDVDQIQSDANNIDQRVSQLRTRAYAHHSLTSTRRRYKNVGTVRLSKAQI